MVRLKGFGGEVCDDEVKRFQFQNGAIKRISNHPLKTYSPSFNSKMVRLKENQTKEEKVNVISFNSKMVRLKVGNGIYDFAPFACFNSKMVRLKGEIGLIGLKAIRWFQFQNGAIKSGSATHIRRT